MDNGKDKFEIYRRGIGGDSSNGGNRKGVDVGGDWNCKNVGGKTEGGKGGGGDDNNEGGEGKTEGGKGEGGDGKTEGGGGGADGNIGIGGNNGAGGDGFGGLGGAIAKVSVNNNININSVFILFFWDIFNYSLS